MKLHELILALADEIESVRPQLDDYLEKLSQLPADDPAFLDNLDLYSGQILRTGEAAEMVGFVGLLDVCQHLQENTMLLADMPPENRTDIIDFLKDWPNLMVHYLQGLDDASIAAGLVDLLREAPHPIDEEHGLRIMHRLAMLPVQVDSGGLSEDTGRPVVASADDVNLTVPEDVDPQLMDSFLQETPDQMTYLVTLVGNVVNADVVDLSDLTAAKRVVHTVKGTGATIGLRGLASLGHHFEDILEYFEAQEGDVPNAAKDILMDAAYCLEQMVSHIAGQDSYPKQSLTILQDVLDLANRIDKGENLENAVRRGGTSAASAPAAGNVQDSPAVAKPAAAALRIQSDKIDQLFRVSEEVSINTAAMEARIKALNDAAKNLLAQNLKVKKRLYELETVVDVRTINMMRSMGNSKDAALDALEMEQYNELHSTAHAMVEDANDSIVMAHELEEAIATLTTMQNRHQLLSKDLQHLVIGTRMAEVNTLSSRLQRNVRIAAQATGKQANLVLKGGETLIDSDVISRLAEPLLHLLRNAVDHGLENPQDRIDAGKNSSGTILLDFSKQGQQVVLSCQDDGRGLDFEAIRHRAIDKGLITEDAVLTEDETAKLIMMPGFSTRDKVSEVSGRGVGLDVVMDWVQGMNGDIKITSVLGQGCTFELRFAASLSTSQALIVRVSGQNFALSSLQIERALSRGVGDFVDADGQFQYHYNDRMIVAKYLADLVGLPRNPDIALEDYCAVILKVNNEVYALAVDTLVDSRELLVKDPGRYTKYLKQIIGISILGDGSVTAHLDMSQLLGSVGQQSGRTRNVAQSQEAGAVAASRKTKVLIVDDSLSVRKGLQELVDDLGHKTQTARDGLDAIDVIDHFQPELVLTDLEMPNMNGVELISHIRSRQDIPNVPIIMITSRSQNKHRQMAEQAGVDEYVTKPYNEDALALLIEKVLVK